MFNRGGSPEVINQGGLFEGLRNHRALMLGMLVSGAMFFGAHSANAAPGLPVQVGYGDVPEQIDDFIEDTPKPAPLDEGYDYAKVNLDRTNKDTVRFYNGCMYGTDGRAQPEGVKASRLVGSNIINASVNLADQCMGYSKWRVFGTMEYRRGNMTSYVESKTTLPAFTSANTIATDVEYGKDYPMAFYPDDVTCQQDPSVKYRVKLVSVRYSLFMDKQNAQQIHSDVISC